jgi:flagellar hook-associated protein 2
MPEIRFPGLATGIDTGEMVKQLVEVESRRLRAKEEERADQQIKSDTLGDLQSKLNAFRTKMRALSDSGLLRSFNSASGDTDIMTASANSNAFEGNHSIQIKQLATTDRWVHDGFEFKEDLVGEGTFIYSYNNEETSVTTTAGTTLEDLVGLINNDSDNPGVNASLLLYDDGNDGVYHLVLSGQDSGSDYTISINGSSTEVWQASSAFTYNSENAVTTNKIIDLDQFGENPLEGGEVIAITGTDRYGNAITPLNIPLTSNTKISHILAEIEDAFGGNVKATFDNGVIYVTDGTSGASELLVILTYNPDGSAATLTLPNMAFLKEGGATTADLTGFTVSDFTRTQAAQDSMIKVGGYPSVTPVAEIQTLSTTVVALGTETFKLTYDGYETSDILVSSGIAGIQAALDALANVNAGDITVGGTGLGAVGDTTFTFTDSAGNVPLIVLDDSGLSGTHSISQTTPGQLDWIKRSTNAVSDVISGVTISLHDDTYNSVTTNYDSVDLTLTRDTEALKEKLNEMVSAYNEIVTFLQENADYDPETKTAPVLYGDYSITTIRSQLKNPFILAAGGFTSQDSFAMPKDIGLTINNDDMLELDSTDFDEAVSDDYLGVLALIGAMKTGSSDSEDIKYYSSGTYTEGGQYNVKVTVSGGAITEAKIWTSDETESEARTVDAENIDGNTVTANSEFDDSGNPLYPENSLTFTVDLTQSGTLEAMLYIQYGFAGEVKDNLDDILTYNGRIPVSKKTISDYIDRLNDQIESEQARLEKFEDRLVLKFARLERTLQTINQQMAGLNMLG